MFVFFIFKTIYEGSVRPILKVGKKKVRCRAVGLLSYDETITLNSKKLTFVTFLQMHCY